MKVFVLELTNPNADGFIRVFKRRENAERAARRWTRDTSGASNSEYRGAGKKENYDASIYAVEVE